MKTLLINMHDSGVEKAPTHAYLDVGAIEADIRKTCRVAGEIDAVSIDKQVKAACLYVADSEFDDHVEISEVRSDILTMTPHQFWLDCRVNKHDENTVESYSVMLSDLDGLPDDDKHPGALDVVFVSEWDSGKVVETDAKANPDNGYVYDIRISQADPEGALERKYIRLASGDECEVFQYPDSDDYYVRPTQVPNLDMDSRQDEDQGEDPGIAPH